LPQIAELMDTCESVLFRIDLDQKIDSYSGLGLIDPLDAESDEKAIHFMKTSDFS